MSVRGKGDKDLSKKMEGTNHSNASEYNNNAQKMAELILALLRRNIGSLERNSFTSRGFTICHLNNVEWNCQSCKDHPQPK